MMGIELRHGKNKPVISKALVRLDGGMFKAYEAVRDKWAILDCYKSPGPIQFSGAGSDAINFMVLPPNVDELIAETKRFEELESKGEKVVRYFDLLSELSKARVQDISVIPSQLEKGQARVSAVKRWFP
jgi:hypothetical protein